MSDVASGSASLPSVRSQLSELASDPRALVSDLEGARRLPVTADDRAREAAVLVLFGPLDTTPAVPRAHAAVPRDLDVLLLARASTLRAHAGQIAFPGGRVDPGDDDAIDAALREAEEETGIDPLGVDVLGAFDPLPLAASGHVVVPVLGWWRRPSAARAVDAAESADVFRVPVADLLDPSHRVTSVTRRDGRVWRGPAFLVPDGREGVHVIWGFTAWVLDRLFQRLGWEEPWDSSRTHDVPA